MSSQVAPTAPADSARSPVTQPRLAEMRARGEPIAMLTCYDASFAALLDSVGIDSLLVGDSLGMVVQGHSSTLPVTLDEVAYHVRCVARATRHAWLIADMPFGSYHASAESALANAVVLMRAGAQMVKLEGGAWLAPTVELFARAGIPVCAHLGLTPQSVHVLGGYRVQGRDTQAADRLVADALALERAGATMLVLEMVPATLAETLSQRLTMPTIGIGAGAGCSGQVLVLHDMLDVYPGRRPRFVRNFMAGASSVREAVERYRDAVKTRAFPAAEHAF
ncbi:MAG: 3-methyl-2-oxobutanoate hydroxymethyltransferase [Burkholderiaceae bacterium]|nr:3-methyl-2-oxobutanoate hydroxymethyltransferase [Burkholderiaceae bacterium]